MGNEFRVNTYENNFQFNPNITTFRNGEFLVVWDSYFNEYDDGVTATYIAAQRYTATGRPIGGEQILHAVDGCKSSDARIATLSDGGYVVTFLFDTYDDILTTKEKVYFRIFNKNGTERTTDAIRVDRVASFDAVAPEVIATANGGFKIIFGIDSAGPKFDQIYSQQFDRAGHPIGGNTLVNNHVGKFDQVYVRSATLNNGTSITIWNSEGTFEIGTDLDSNEIRGTITNRNGSVRRGDFHLSDNIGTVGYGGDGAGYDVASLNNGGFVISHRETDLTRGGDLISYAQVQLFNANGHATSRILNAYRTDEVIFQTRVTQMDNGQIVVVWEQYSDQPGQIGEDIYARIFSKAGKPLSGRFEVGVDADKYDSQESPEVAALAGGGFIVTYTSESIDSDNEGIAARIYGRGTAQSDVAKVDRTGMFAGLGGDDAITGNLRANLISGGSGSDRAAGARGNDSLTGGAGDDALFGGAGDDRLSGGRGMDKLTGGDGADLFIFRALPGTGADRITDFNAADTIVLDHRVFAHLAKGPLDPAQFKLLNSGPADADDRILYDRTTGTLWYDANGSRPGGRMVIAELDGTPALTAADFLII
jgi:Ca2+-binding RTX toxin-like protein